jgi:hypothetical protein
MSSMYCSGINNYRRFKVDGSFNIMNFPTTSCLTELPQFLSVESNPISLGVRVLLYMFSSLHSLFTQRSKAMEMLMMKTCFDPKGGETCLSGESNLK